MSARSRALQAGVAVLTMASVVIADAETIALAQAARMDPDAGRSFATVQQRVLRFADEHGRGLRPG